MNEWPKIYTLHGRQVEVTLEKSSTGDRYRVLVDDCLGGALMISEDSDGEPRYRPATAGGSTIDSTRYEDEARAVDRLIEYHEDHPEAIDEACGSDIYG